MAGGLIDPQQVREDLNLIERAISYFTGSDEYKAAMLRNQKIMTEALLEQSGRGGTGRVNISQVDIEDLPRGLVGKTVDSSPSGSQVPVVFDISGSKFYATATPTGNVDEDETVVITGNGNKVRPEPTSDQALKSLTGYSDPLTNFSTIPPADVLDMANQIWDSGSVREIDIGSNLGPGEDVIVGSVKNPEAGDSIGIRTIGVTSHLADIDADNKDESVVRYEYEYKATRDSDWTTHKTLTGTLPMGSLDSPHEISQGKVMGPLHGFRIRIINRTDDKMFSDKQVEKDDLGGRIKSIVM